MLVNFAVTILVSLLAILLFRKSEVFPLKVDVINAFSPGEKLSSKQLWHLPPKAEIDKLPSDEFAYGNPGFSTGNAEM